MLEIVKHFNFALRLLCTFFSFIDKHFHRSFFNPIFVRWNPRVIKARFELRKCWFDEICVDSILFRNVHSVHFIEKILSFSATKFCSNVGIIIRCICAVNWFECTFIKTMVNVLIDIHWWKIWWAYKFNYLEKRLCVLEVEIVFFF